MKKKERKKEKEKHEEYIFNKTYLPNRRSPGLREKKTEKAATFPLLRFN